MSLVLSILTLLLGGFPWTQADDSEPDDVPEMVMASEPSDADDDDPEDGDSVDDDETEGAKPHLLWLHQQNQSASGGSGIFNGI